MRSMSMSKGRKRIAVAAAVGAACLAASGVYATTLLVTANQDAGGTAVVTACQTAEIKVESDAPVYDETGDAYKVAGFTVKNVDTACTGTLYVSAISESNTQIQPAPGVQFTWTLDGVATSKHFAFTDAQLSSVLKNYTVAIHNTNPVA